MKPLSIKRVGGAYGVLPYDRKPVVHYHLTVEDLQFSPQQGVLRYDPLQFVSRSESADPFTAHLRKCVDKIRDIVCRPAHHGEVEAHHLSTSILHFGLLRRLEDVWSGHLLVLRNSRAPSGGEDSKTYP